MGTASTDAGYTARRTGRQITQMTGHRADRRNNARRPGPPRRRTPSHATGERRPPITGPLGNELDPVADRQRREPRRVVVEWDGLDDLDRVRRAVE